MKITGCEKITAIGPNTESKSPGALFSNEKTYDSATMQDAMFNKQSDIQMMIALLILTLLAFMFGIKSSIQL